MSANYPSYDEGAVSKMREYDRTASGPGRPEGGLAQIANMLDQIEGTFRQANARIETNLGRILCQPTAEPSGKNGVMPAEDASIPAISSRLHRMEGLAAAADGHSRILAEQV